jgi:hypothetical protein
MINDFTQELQDQLEKYGQLIDEKVLEAAQDATKELAATLKTVSPKRKVNGGAYAKDWRVKKQARKYTVYNAKHYQLTHLLEKGHATRNGGRTRAFPHIIPEGEQAIEKFLAALDRMVEETT